MVTSAVGNLLPWRARAAVPVSPVRTSTVQCGARSAAARCEGEAGVAGQARSGVIQSEGEGGRRPALPGAPSTSGGSAAA